VKRIDICGRFVGQDASCFIIVDAGVNHNNDPHRALALVEEAARAGADVVKFQTYKADTIATKTAERYWDPKLDTDNGGTQYDTFSRIDGLPESEYRSMKERAVELGIILSSTPFNLDDVELLERLGLDVYKIASADIVHHELIEKVAELKKPIILSTGCSSISEIEEAINCILKYGTDDIILQHCILSYPCRDENANLAKMVKLQEIFSDFPVGYSDHTLGITVPLAAIALGAKTVEKHFTLDKSLPDSPDHSLSIDPDELKSFVMQKNRIEAAKGVFKSGPYPAEEKAVRLARKSVVAATDIPQGTKITKGMLICKRPGTGIQPKHLKFVIGRISAENISEDTTLTWEMVNS